MANASSNPLPRRRHLQFSLRAILVVLTLVAIAGWWWQKRFRVTSTSTVSQRTSQGVEKVEFHTTETKRRQGLDVVLDGPTTVVDEAGNMISEEQWRSGVRHGVYRRWDDAGKLLFECEFRRGRLVRFGDTSVADFLPSGAAAKSPTGIKLLRHLKRETSFDYLDQPLAAVTEDISFTNDIPVMMDVRAITSAGVDKDVPITAAIRGVPLFMALVELLAPLKLACACRYDVLWITTPDSVLHDDDLAPSVALEHASPELLRALSSPARFDYSERPLGQVLEEQASIHKIAITSELIDDTKPVTLHLQSFSLSSTLGMLIYLYDLRCEAQGDKLVVSDAEHQKPGQTSRDQGSHEDDSLRRD